MCTQIVPIEGYSVSLIKVAAMSLAPILFIIGGYFKRISDSLVYGVIILVMMFVCAALASPFVAWDRIGYRAMYVFMFILITGILYEGCISLSLLKRLLITLLLLYGIVMILQHILLLTGIRQFPLLNYNATITMAGVFKVNGLAAESSHAARIMTVMYWGTIKLVEIENKHKLTFRNIIQELPCCTVLFFLSMLTMGSATAIIGMLLIFIYILNKNIGLFLIALVGFIMIMSLDVDNVQIQRVQKVFFSIFSDDVGETLKNSEGSGAVRILPIINTFKLNLFSLDTWIGQGSTYNPNTSFIDRVFSSNRYIGDITSFGLLSYIASLVFVYKCCIRKFFSIETLLFLCLATFSVGSVYYTWFMFIVFASIRFIENQSFKSDQETTQIENI